jgi:hypothetical protein
MQAREGVLRQLVIPFNDFASHINATAHPQLPLPVVINLAGRFAIANLTHPSNHKPACMHQTVRTSGGNQTKADTGYSAIGSLFFPGYLAPQNPGRNMAGRQLSCLRNNINGQCPLALDKRVFSKLLS